ncbi:MAG TPA: LuxR C-terminal-related transcriptional regulator [Ktedonobacteraceae bacterium]
MLQTTLQADTFERYMDEYEVDRPLITKLLSPVLTQGMQTRTRLLTLLQGGLSHPLVLVSAPAGSGKTTLLAQWVQSLADEQIAAAWVSLDPSDNEPSRFWNVLLTALTQKFPVFGSLQGSKGIGSISNLLTLLINTGAAQQEPIVLVLDDYHTITDSTIQKQMAYFIEHLPPHMHIVLSTRLDPYLPLARLRMRRQVLEVRMDALRFTYEEATLFLHEVMHLSLTTAEIIYLVDHVDGWIAGLRLAGCALYEPYTAKSVSVAARGSQRYILDYIFEEVLSSLDEHIQTFLLRTAFLSHFSPPLCDAVLNRQDSWQILQQMERANLFLVAEDHEHTQYHYQTLFAEALRSHLERTQSDLIPVLRRRASDWYEQHGFLVDAKERNILVLSSPQEKEVDAEPQMQQTLASQHLLDPLSTREIEVLHLMARGDSNVEIANDLIIAPATVKRHVSNILSKLQATNRTQGVAVARTIGIL